MSQDETYDGVHRRLPAPLRTHIAITEVDEGGFFAGELFRRKFGDPPPPVPHHVVAFVRTGEGGFVPIAYTHFYRTGAICLVGGMSTDGRAFAHLPEAMRQAVAAAGGLACYMLHYGFARFADAKAFFGHVGDARAREVDLRAGFRDTAHEHLMVYFPRPLPEPTQQALIAQAHAIGPF